MSVVALDYNILSDQAAFANNYAVAVNSNMYSTGYYRIPNTHAWLAIVEPYFKFTVAVSANEARCVALAEHYTNLRSVTQYDEYAVINYLLPNKFKLYLFFVVQYPIKYFGCCVNFAILPEEVRKYIGLYQVGE